MPHQQTHYVHISHVNDYKKCRQLHHWSSPQGLNLTPIDKYAPFFTGSLMHHALEYWYRFGTPTDSAISGYLAQETTPEQRSDPKLLEQIELVKGLLKHYHLWQKYDQTVLADQGFNFIANEQRFELPLWSNSRHKIMLAGVFDGVVQSQHDHKFYLWELKTTRSITEREKQLQLDSQTDAYTNAASRMLGVPLSGIVYTLMRKAVPDDPKILNDRLSLNKKDMSAEWYLDYAKQFHNSDKKLIQEYYGSFLNELLANGNSYFKRVIVNRSQYELDDSWKQLQAVAREMINPNTPIYLNESYGCSYCLFRRPCIAKRAGQDYELILRNGYKYNERYADEVSE